jgi:hypothetical protein
MSLAWAESGYAVIVINPLPGRPGLVQAVASYCGQNGIGVDIVQD